MIFIAIYSAVREEGRITLRLSRRIYEILYEWEDASSQIREIGVQAHPQPSADSPQ
jgi:hypothetical protein